MDLILHQLAELLLKAIPTFLLVLLLHFYLKFIFFKPLGKVLNERYEATEGARKRAEESLQRASEMVAKYEAAMRVVRSEVYQHQEQIHKQLQERETAELDEARRQAEAAIQEARKALAQDVDAAKSKLSVDSETLANQIAEAILRGNAA